MKRRYFLLGLLTTFTPISAFAKTNLAPFTDTHILKTKTENDKWLGWWEGPWNKINRDGGLFVHRVFKEGNGKYKAEVSYWLSYKYESSQKNTKISKHMAKINRKNNRLSFNGLSYRFIDENTLRVEYKKDSGVLHKIK